MQFERRPVNQRFTISKRSSEVERQIGVGGQDVGVMKLAERAEVRNWIVGVDEVGVWHWI